MKTKIFGYSSEGLPIPSYQFGGSENQVLILGGVHGDEIEGVIGAHALLDHFQKQFNYNLKITIVPQFNMDGVIRCQRVNANKIDLNRNLPTKDWTSEVAKERYNPGPSACSESENQALVSWLDENKPKFVLSLHSWKPMLNVNGNCHEEAEVIRHHTSYIIEESIGYPTPGCLGTYAALERDMPTLTYEFERGMRSDQIIKVHIPAILESLKKTEAKA